MRLSQSDASQMEAGHFGGRHSPGEAGSPNFPHFSHSQCVSRLLFCHKDSVRKLRSLFTLAPGVPLSLKNAHIFGSAVAVTGILLFSSIPTGVPGEWEWPRHASMLSRIDRWLLPLIAAGIVFGIGVGVDRQFQSWGMIRRTTAVILLVPLTWIWLSAVQLATPAEFSLLKDTWVLYDPGSSGYFHESVYNIDSKKTFLAEYETRMAEGDVLHVGTHPPGLFLLSMWCIQHCEESPRLTEMLSPDSELRSAFGNLRSGFGRSLRPPEWAGLILLGLLTRLAVALSVIPITLLTGKLFGARAAWRVGILWCTLPCLSVFLPKSDVLFTLTSSTALLLYFSGTEKASRYWLAVVAGVVLWFGLFMSLAHLPVLAVFGAFAGLRFVKDRKNHHPITALFLLVGGTFFCATAFHIKTDCNLLEVWKQNLTNHSGFYLQFPRTYWKWLLVNPLELAFAIGLPVYGAFVWGYFRVMRSAARRGPDVDANKADGGLSAALLSAVLLTWVALWLSGKNMGEAARLWCFLTPMMIPAVGGLWCRQGKSDERQAAPGFSLLLGAQLACCILTVGTISGFSALTAGQ